MKLSFLASCLALIALGGCNRVPIHSPGLDGHAKRERESLPVNRPIAMGVIQPIRPGEIRSYPEHERFTVARSPREANLLGTPDYYDPENDLYFHSIHLTWADYRHMIATYGRVPLVPQVPMHPRRPAIETDLAAVAEDTEAIIAILTEHPQMLSDMYMVDAFALDAGLADHDGRVGVVHPGGGGARTMSTEVLPSIAAIDRALQVILDGDVPTRVRQRLLRDRQIGQARSARAMLGHGLQAYSRLFDGSWAMVAAQSQDPRVHEIMAAWRLSYDAWMVMLRSFDDGATPSYDALARLMEDHTRLLRRMQTSVDHEAFAAGRMTLDRDDVRVHYPRLRRNMVRAHSEITQAALAVVRSYRPLRVVPDGSSAPQSIYTEVSLE